MTEKNLSSDPSYTCVGSFNDQGTLYLATYLPPGMYDFPSFDVSIDDNGTIINAVLLVLKKDNDTGTDLRWLATNPLHTISPINLTTDKFDVANDKCLILIYHEVDFDATDYLKSFKDNVKGWYEDVDRYGSTTTLFNPEKPLPKKLGMSIVRKY